MTARIDPVWGDDLMVAEAVGVIAPSGRPHPTTEGDLSDLVLALAVQTWELEAEAWPIPLVPTVHEPCDGCGTVLCGCEVPCEGMPLDVCSHYGRPHCPDCGPRACVLCRGDQLRWDRPRGDR